MTVQIQGVWNIVRYNYPFYVVALGVGLAGVLGALFLNLGAVGNMLLIGAAMIAFYFILASLITSWYVYDYSPLYKWGMLKLLVNPDPQAWLTVHTGIDDITPVMKHLFPGTEGDSVDIYDPAVMTEGSIARARAYQDPSFPPVDSEVAWAKTDHYDWAFLIFAAHEIRSYSQRALLFENMYRSLRPGGKVLVIEHMRDLANIAVFGPGALHFFSYRNWLSIFRKSGFRIHEEETITPFVKIFVLQK